MHWFILPALLIFGGWERACAAVDADIVIINKTWEIVSISSGSGLGGYPSQVGIGTNLTYEVKNLSNAPLTLLPITVSDVTNCVVKVVQAPTAVIGPRASSQMVIHYVPALLGNWQFAVLARSNSTAIPAYRWLAHGDAQATKPRMVMYDQTAILADGAADAVAASSVGVAAVKTLTIANIGSGPLQVNSITFGDAKNCSADIANAPDYMGFIASGEASDLSLQMTPTAIGPWSVMVTVLSNDVRVKAFRVMITGEASPALPMRWN